MIGILAAIPSWRPRGLSKSVVSRVIVRVAPFRVLITLLTTHLLSPLDLQVLTTLQHHCLDFFIVVALLIIGGYLMRFFSLFKPGPKKWPAQIMRFFWGWAFLGWVSSCLLMVNLKAATT